MFEQICLGTAQGITEWLPISSEGVIVLLKTHFFHHSQGIETIIKEALWLHLGTFFAALVYFFKEVHALIKSLFDFKNQPAETQKLFVFLIVSTLISGILGLLLIKTLADWIDQTESWGRWITISVGLLLVITGILDFRSRRQNFGHKNLLHLNLKESAILGVVQGCAALPGLSRSGLTVSTLLLRGFGETHALTISFLMSLPIVLAGNILLNWNAKVLSGENLVGLLFSFGFGLATIHVLLQLSRKINFGIFVLGFGGLTILSAFI